MKHLFYLLTLSCTLLTGCIYKMPNRDCISTLPNLNNPDLTGERKSAPLPR